MKGDTECDTEDRTPSARVLMGRVLLPHLLPETLVPLLLDMLSVVERVYKLIIYYN